MITMAEKIHERAWPSANLQHVFRIRGPPRVLSPDNHRQVIALLTRNIPLVVNLYLYKNQVAFFENTLLVSGMSRSNQERKSKNVISDEGLVAARPVTLIAGDSFTSKVRVPAAGITSKHIMLPHRQGDKLERGHCVIACGYVHIDGKVFLRMRNSFGFRWGCMGDFTMSLEDVCPDQVHRIVYFEPEMCDVSGRQ